MQNPGRFNLNIDKLQRDRKSDDRARKYQRELGLDDFVGTLKSTTPLAERLADRQATADRLQTEIRSGAEMTAAFSRNELADMDAAIARDFPTVDPTLRSLFHGSDNGGRHGADFDLNVRAMGATARASIGNSFGAASWPALVGSAPVLDLCQTVFTGSNGSPYEFGVGSVAAAALITEGGSISATDLTFTASTLQAYKYATLLQYSSELASDGSFDFESYVRNRLANPGGGIFRDLGDDLAVGDGSSKPQSYFAGVTTVAAASATTVVLADIGKLFEELPSQYLFSGATLLISAGAYHDLRRETLGTSAAGGMAVDQSNPIGGLIMGIPFRVDVGLTNPTTSTVTAVVAHWPSSYVARLTAMRIDTDMRAAFAADQWMTRITLRADGHVTVPDAARALVMG
jgi:HK97 family phage major capsid protein